LSILYQQDGLSFLVRHHQTRQLYLAGFLPKSQWGNEPMEELASSFTEPFKDIRFAIEAPHTVLLPQVMVESDEIGWTQKVLGQKANFSDISESLGMAFFAYLSEDDQAYSQSTTYVRRHNWALQLEALGSSEQPKFWVHMYNTDLFIAAQMNGVWELVNSFPCANESELMYHLGNCAEQLAWERKDIHVELSGNSAREYKEVIQPYFGTVKLFKPQDWAKISSSMKEFDGVVFATLLRL
jgi:hypothetical protein